MIFDVKSVALNQGSCDGEGRGSLAAASRGGRAIASLPSPFQRGAQTCFPTADYRDC